MAFFGPCPDAMLQRQRERPSFQNMSHEGPDFLQILFVSGPASLLRCLESSSQKRCARLFRDFSLTIKSCSHVLLQDKDASEISLGGEHPRKVWFWRSDALDMKRSGFWSS